MKYTTIVLVASLLGSILVNINLLSKDHGHLHKAKYQLDKISKTMTMLEEGMVHDQFKKFINDFEHEYVNIGSDEKELYIIGVKDGELVAMYQYSKDDAFVAFPDKEKPNKAMQQGRPIGRP